jgi:hypothetical protein
MPQPAFLFWFSSYVHRHHLALVLQSSAKDQFYSSVYYKIFNSIFVVQRSAKNFKKIVEDRFGSRNE